MKFGMNFSCSFKNRDIVKFDIRFSAELGRIGKRSWLVFLTEIFWPIDRVVWLHNYNMKFGMNFSCSFKNRDIVKFDIRFSAELAKEAGWFFLQKYSGQSIELFDHRTKVV